MQGAGPVSHKEEYLVGCGAGCSHECHPHPAVTSGGSLCASLGKVGAQPLRCPESSGSKNKRGG